MPSNFISFPLALVPVPVHFTAAPLPATKTESSVRAQLLKFFEAWGMTDEATLAARRKLSSLLFS